MIEKKFQIGLIVEYSRMKVPSLSRGCEIAKCLFATWNTWNYYSVIVCNFHMCMLSSCCEFESPFDNDNGEAFQNLRLGSIKIFENAF